MSSKKVSETAIDLSDIANRLGYSMHFARSGYEFRSKSGAGDFTVKNLAQARKMLDLIGTAVPAVTVGAAKQWIKLDRADAAADELVDLARNLAIDVAKLSAHSAPNELEESQRPRPGPRM